MAQITIQQLNFTYEGAVTPVFKNMSATLDTDWRLGLIGRNGRGKTTLLRLLAGELAPQQGDVRLCGISLASAPEAYRAQVFWHDPRSHALHALSARDWWASLPARHSGWQASALAAHIDGLALAAHADKPMYQLSSGSQRKVILAAGLASGAALTLVDEPLAGLDWPSMAYVQQALAALAAAPGQRAVLVAHYEALPGVACAAVLDLPEAVD